MHVHVSCACTFFTGRRLDITNDSQYNGHVGNRNPIRYRGYYFDAETGLYWLTTRFYDPETGRFISQDEYSYLDPDSINGLNLFAYCKDNPVMMTDPAGNFALAIFLISLAVGSLISWGASQILGSQVVGGIGSIASGASAITSGVGLLTLGPIGWVVGGALILVGASTIVFGANEIVAGVTGTNYIQQWTGMSDSLYNGLCIGLNIASSVGTITANTYLSLVRTNALNALGKSSYGPKASRHIGQRSYYDSILTQREIVKYGKIYKARFGVRGYEFRIKGGAIMGKNSWQSITAQGLGSAMTSGTWSLVYGKGIIWHFLFN